jgi:hypothetical protein
MNYLDQRTADSKAEGSLKVREQIMTFLRKLEVTCGVATAVLGVIATAQMFVVDLNTSRRLNESFPISRWVFGALILYILPGFLVALGSYIDASRARSWGLALLLISSLLLTTVFLLMFLSRAFTTTRALFYVSFVFAVMSIVTVIIALLVRYREPT